MSDDTKKTKLIVPGRHVEPPKEASNERIAAKFDVEIEALDAVEVDSTERGTAERFESGDLDDDVVVEMEFDDGVREWTTVGALRERMQRTDRAMVSDENEIFIPRAIPLAAGARRERGAVDLALKGLKFFNIDPQDTLADMAVDKIIDHFEQELEYGLYQYTKEGEPRKDGAVENELPSQTAPYLVLLHGTFSTTQTSFSALLKKDDTPKATDEWRNLYTHYGEQVFGFDHKTLGESPIQNAVHLVKLLPRNANVHLVSHSRGGLIGELLCHGPLSEEDIRVFERRERPAAEVEALHELSGLLRDKDLQIERFVRVAAPGRGTVLASERFDRYLSILLNLIGTIPGLDESLVYPFVKGTILTLVKKRTEPEKVPGLEALMPKSPLVRLLNDPNTTSDADLAIIAGDAQGQGVLGRLGILATNLFFWEDHDLVVNTRSMYQGVRRDKPAYFAFHQSAEVDHFHYFANPDTRTEAYQWLTRADTDPTPEGFEELTPEKMAELQRTRFRGKAPDDAPVVFVIPGLMATHLKREDTRVWLDMGALAGGAFGDLALDGPGATVDDVIAANYQALLDHLGARFQVELFPYDWRDSMLSAGTKLADQIEDELRQVEETRAVYLLAHSQGGLVARAMIAQRPETWKQITRRGGRLVMLGTPNGGTYTAMQLLTGTAPAVQMLQMLDPDGDADAIARIMRTFPGLVEMLPDLPDGDVWSEEWWADHAGDTFNTVKERKAFGRLLRAAREAREALSEAVDPEHMCYVAGQDANTPAAAVWENGRLRYRATSQGDGVVPHRLGPLSEVPTWYMEAAHGDLANNEPAFGALANLLQTGTTDMLSTSISTRGLGIVSAEEYEAEPLLFPTESDLVATTTGSRIPIRDRGEEMMLRVHVAHGSLEYASHPVAVGHYYGDVIVGAESFLDWKLNGRLSRRQEMNLYPGAVGTAEVLFTSHGTPPGGMIVGLGEVGQITPEILTRGVTEAALRLALSVAERPPKPDEPPGWRSAAFSSVLMGTNGGRSLSIESSISAIVKGALLANWTLRERGLWNTVRIDEVEFVELYQDIATRAAHAVHDLDRHLRVLREGGEKIKPARHLKSLEGGLLGRPALEYNTGWWRRLQITEITDEEDEQRRRLRAALAELEGVELKEEEKEEESPAGALKYVMLTDRARAEEILQATQRPLIDRFVEEAVSKRNPPQDLPATLFELLFPNTFKDQSQEQANLVLVLDRNAAQYPWEMLAERQEEDRIVPLAHRMGIIRQLTTAHFRERVQPPRGTNALVIGEPKLGKGAPYPPLPGARDEAARVAGELRKHGYDVTELVGDDATGLQILNKLYAKEYRILHIAGHGIYDARNPSRSGVVIGDDIFLTAAEIQQLRVVPELVFLNCCHLANVDEDEPTEMTALRQTQRAWNKLAASVSEELIKIGVRAVVAAGWAVDDDAALLFATEFYSQMLAGPNREFGRAVHVARQSTYDTYHHRTNTWGAYQCYGEPSFVLGTGGGGGGDESLPFVAKHELVERLEDIERAAATAVSAARKAQEEELRELLRTIPSEWLTGETLHRFGAAFGELGVFEEAVRYYRQALSSWGADVPIRMVEQLANLEARYAEQLRTSIEEDSEPAVTDDLGTPDELLEQAKKRLDWVLEIGRTPERLALVGSRYKRVALAARGDDRVEALTDAREYYKQAHERGREAGKPDPYHALNWITLRFLTDEDVDTDDLLDLIEWADETAEKRESRSPDFWNRATLADLTVIKALIEEDLRGREADIISAYGRAFSKGVTARQRSSVIEQFDFLATMCTWKKMEEATQSLRRLRDTITG